MPPARGFHGCLGPRPQPAAPRVGHRRRRGGPRPRPCARARGLPGGRRAGGGFSAPAQTPPPPLGFSQWNRQAASRKRRSRGRRQGAPGRLARRAGPSRSWRPPRLPPRPGPSSAVAPSRPRWPRPQNGLPAGPAPKSCSILFCSPGLPRAHPASAWLPFLALAPPLTPPPRTDPAPRPILHASTPPPQPGLLLLTPPQPILLTFTLSLSHLITLTLPIGPAPDPVLTKLLPLSCASHIDPVPHSDLFTLPLPLSSYSSRERKLCGPQTDPAPSLVLPTGYAPGSPPPCAGPAPSPSFPVLAPPTAHPSQP